MKAQINEFGQTPKQIFQAPHVQRRSKMTVDRPIPGQKAFPKATDAKKSREKIGKGAPTLGDSPKPRPEAATPVEEIDARKKEKTLGGKFASKKPSLNQISNEIFDLIGEANENLQSQAEKKGKARLERAPDTGDRPVSDLGEILEQVKKMLPETEGAAQRPPDQDEDMYFNFVSSKSFDLKKEIEFRNDK